MFNKICDETKVPNSYIYTSHTGSEYIFMEGTWINCKTMLAVPSSKNHKMEKSALLQIAEQNKSSTLKIGTQYTLNEGNYTFIGSGKITLNGNVLNESMSASMISLMEAAESVPDGFTYVSSKGKRYIKKAGRWLNTLTMQPINTSAAQSLERSAAQRIQEHNKENVVKIGQEWKSSKGKTYKYVGDDHWMGADGKMLPSNVAKQVTAKFNAKAQDQKVSPDDEKIDKAEEEVPNEVQTPSKSEPKATSSPQSSEGSDEGDELSALAEKIKANPERVRITVLLNRGDDISLLAADILLSGEQKKYAELLKTLNNEEN